MRQSTFFDVVSKPFGCSEMTVGRHSLKPRCFSPGSRHQLWECRICGSRKRQSSPRATLRYRACPKCRYRTLEEDEQVTWPASATRRGLKVTTRRCHHCGYSAEFKTKLAQKRAVLGRSAGSASGASAYDTSSSSSSSYDYSGSLYDCGSTSSYDSGTSSSDSGGSSSGDGASGSW